MLFLLALLRRARPNGRIVELCGPARDVDSQFARGHILAQVVPAMLPRNTCPRICCLHSSALRRFFKVKFKGFRLTWGFTPYPYFGAMDELAEIGVFLFHVLFILKFKGFRLCKFPILCRVRPSVCSKRTFSCYFWRKSNQNVGVGCAIEDAGNCQVLPHKLYSTKLLSPAAVHTPPHPHTPTPPFRLISGLEFADEKSEN